MRVVGPVLVCAVLLTAGQLLWKYGLQKMGGFHPGASGLGHGLMALCLSPYIVAGLAIYVVATALWLNVLSKAPLSLALPLLSLSYVLGVLAAHLIFKEQVPITRWLGTLIICAGICLVAWK